MQKDLELKKKLEKMLDSSLVIDEMLLTTKIQAGDNYLSEAYGLKIIGHSSSGKLYKRFVFLKRIPNSMIIQNTFNCDQAFINEQIFYQKFLKYQKLHPSVPRCLGADSDTILMEDLLYEGFSSTDRKMFLSLPHVKLILEELAKFHSCSFYLKKFNRSLYEEIKSELKPILPMDVLENFFENSLKSCFEVLNEDEDDFKDIIELLKQYSGKITSILHEKNNSANNLKVIIHGDIWLKNIMFKYENEYPNKVCLLDFQNIREASLVIDLITVIWVNTQARLDYKTLLMYYHTSLSTLLKSYDIEPPSYFVLINDYNSCSILGLFISLLYLPALCLDESVFENTTHNDAIDNLMNDNRLIINPLYKQKVKELIKYYKHNYM